MPSLRRSTLGGLGGEEAVEAAQPLGHGERVISLAPSPVGAALLTLGALVLAVVEEAEHLIQARVGAGLRRRQRVAEAAEDQPPAAQGLGVHRGGYFVDD